MNLILIIIFGVVALTLLIIGLLFLNKSIQIGISATQPDAERQYWLDINKKLRAGFLVGAIGAALAAGSLALRYPIPAEAGCITLLASLVLPLAYLCRKTAFKPSSATELTQKHWKLILLITAFIALFLTQRVFHFFITA